MRVYALKSSLQHASTGYFMDCDLSSSIPDWIIDHPDTLAVLQSFNLDVSCAGKSLEYVVIKQGLDTGVVLKALLRQIGIESEARSSDD